MTKCVDLVIEYVFLADLSREYPVIPSGLAGSGTLLFEAEPATLPDLETRTIAADLIGSVP